MLIKYELEVSPKTLEKSFNKIINLTYKLLPMREEGGDWVKPLETIIEELAGMDRLLFGFQGELFPILCKLEGLYSLTREEDFLLFRRVIFECLALLNNLKYESFR